MIDSTTAQLWSVLIGFFDGGESDALKRLP